MRCCPLAVPTLCMALLSRVAVPPPSADGGLVDVRLNSHTKNKTNQYKSMRNICNKSMSNLMPVVGRACTGVPGISAKLSDLIMVLSPLRDTGRTLVVAIDQLLVYSSSEVFCVFLCSS